MIANPVKLVIWDLDETFWSGTLAEGAIEKIDRNCDMVIQLAERGVISSIASKNDFDAAAAKLKEFGVWDYFVLPQIVFGPKGQLIADLIDSMNLRAENVLFIDDNHLNREEAKHYAAGLMTADPKDVLPGILELPALKGKDDRGLSRLKQYKTIESKRKDQLSTVSNEEFLRQCEIYVTIDFDIESDFERLVELANRTNQLNFTKRRLEDPDAIADFRRLLTTFGCTAGFVRVSDRYGDYGVVGYFVQQRNASVNKLSDFVFSCRAMNMGIEQYVYERLGSPEIKVVGPVSNPIQSFAKIDWIKEGRGPSNSSETQLGKQLLVVGACDLLQLAAMCGERRAEFVNTVRNKWMVRFDDPGFITGDRKMIQNDPDLKGLHYWTHDDAIQFDAALAKCEVVLSSFFAATNWTYFQSEQGVQVRIAEFNVRRLLKQEGLWFVRHFTHVKLTFRQRFDLIRQSLDHITAATGKNAVHFSLGANTRGLPGRTSAILKHKIPGSREIGDNVVQARLAYNAFLREYCESHDKCVFVDVESILAPDDIIGRDKVSGKFFADHFTRRGYLKIAKFIAASFRQLTEQRLAAE
jgi:FkbH-like protein